MEIVFFWFCFSIVVAVAANARGREGVLWFFISVIISPLIALLLVLVMDRKNAPPTEAAVGASASTFEPDAVHAGIPYRSRPDGSIEAIMQGGRVRFSDYKKFAAATGTPMPPPP